MSLLPKAVVKAENTNPRSMVIFSQPKTGKTQFCSALPDSLLLDVENGSNFVDAQKINVIQIAKEKDVSPLTVLHQIVSELRSVKKDTGKFPYTYGIIDTATALEDMTLEIANNDYRNTPQGRNWQGNDVRTLPNGAGYYFTRVAFSKVITMLQDCFEYFIILGHLKDKMVDKEGKEMPVRALDLTGKVSNILCSQVDAIGYMYREDNKTLINFQPSESLVVGSRSQHLKNKTVVAVEELPDGTFKYGWDEIFKPSSN